MYELVQVAEKTYYINCPAKIGIYNIDENLKGKVFIPAHADTVLLWTLLNMF